jgi:hypothetical protein
LTESRTNSSEDEESVILISKKEKTGEKSDSISYRSDRLYREPHSRRAIQAGLPGAMHGQAIEQPALAEGQALRDSQCYIK